MKVTINDVAKKAGVANSTVSLVINKRPGASLDTSQKVLKVIKELNYRPLKAAQALTTKKTKNIGFMDVIVSHNNQSQKEKYSFSTMIPTFAYDVARGIEQETQRRGYGLLFSTYYGRQLSSIKNFPPMIKNYWIDGLLLVGGTFSEDFIKMLKKWKIPLVLVGSHLPSDRIDCVLADNAGGAFKAIEHFIKLGYSEIGFINAPPTTQTSFDKMQGYLSALQKYGIEYNEKLVEIGDFTAQSGYQAMKKLLAKTKNLKAVFIAFDGMAIGAKKAIIESELKIPGDISIIGFQDSWIANHFDPPLTTVRVHKHEIGVVAARRLFELMDSKRTEKPIKTMIPTELIIRQSCIVHG